MEMLGTIALQGFGVFIVLITAGTLTEAMREEL